MTTIVLIKLKKGMIKLLEWVVIVFFAAFFESVAFLGVFVPGTIIVLFSGFVAEQWPLAYDVRGLMIIVALGCFLGAAASYLVGRFYGPPFFSETSFYLKRRYLIRAQQYFAAHGGKNIFFDCNGADRFFGQLHGDFCPPDFAGSMMRCFFAHFNCRGNFSHE